MDTETGIAPNTSNIGFTDTSDEFMPGMDVIYGMHGRCSVSAIESRQIGGMAIRFYKLEVQKSSLSRSQRQDPAIWVPVDNARERGLRAPINRAEAEEILKIFSSREYYFQLNENWSAVQPKLESAIRNEGGIGLAKVSSYLYVVKRKQIVPTSEVNRLHESVNKLLFRELSEVLGEPIRAIEEKVMKSVKQKFVLDT